MKRRLRDIVLERLQQGAVTTEELFDLCKDLKYTVHAAAKQVRELGLAGHDIVKVPYRRNRNGSISYRYSLRKK